MPRSSWSTADVPPLAGKIAVVTGANRGLGLQLAGALAQSGAQLVLGCRDLDKAAAAIQQIRQLAPAAQPQALHVDLASLQSIRAFAQECTQRYPRVDLLCHNAAAIMAPQSRTQDGFEMHIGTNFLGAFALTGLLLDALKAAPAARVVTTGSLAHRMTPGLNMEDPHFKHRPYREMDAYGASKLAALSYTFELDRRLRAAGLPVLSVAAHPGYTATNLNLGNFFIRLSTRLFAQKPEIGMLPALYAATAADVRSGEYFGPSGYKELSGPPRRVDARPEARDPALAARLWNWAQQSTGVSYL